MPKKASSHSPMLKLGKNLFLRTHKIGSSVFVNVWHPEGFGSFSLVSMEIEHSGRIIMRSCTDGRVAFTVLPLELKGDAHA